MSFCFIGPRLLTEEDIPGSSLAGCPPATFKNKELKFWLNFRTDLSKFLEKITEIDATCGLAQTCEIDNIDNTIPTGFGYTPPPADHINCHLVRQTLKLPHHSSLGLRSK